MENFEIIRYKPLTDAVFNYLFSDESTHIAVEEIVNNVLLSVGDAPIKTITSVVSQYALIGETLGARGGRLDIRAVADDNTLFDIEVQLSNQIFMNDRSWFYGGRLLSEAFKEGEDYKRMPRVCVINLLNFDLRATHPDYLQPIGVMYKKAPMEVASDAFRIYNIELTKFRKAYPTKETALTDPLARWLYLLDRGYKDEGEMEEIAKMTEGMKAFAQKYNRSLEDPRLRDLYELELSARRDKAAIADTARLEGRREGRLEGEKQGEKRANELFIRNMLKQKAPMDLIYACVDAPRAEIDAIIAKLRAQH